MSHLFQFIFVHSIYLINYAFLKVWWLCTRLCFILIIIIVVIWQCYFNSTNRWLWPSRISRQCLIFLVIMSTMIIQFFIESLLFEIVFIINLWLSSSTNLWFLIFRYVITCMFKVFFGYKYLHAITITILLLLLLLLIMMLLLLMLMLLIHFIFIKDTIGLRSLWTCRRFCTV